MFGMLGTQRMAVKEDLNILRDALRELVTSTLDKAGKGKSEVIKILGREIGQALAAVLKEPLDQLIKTRKVNICIELVERDNTPGEMKDPSDASGVASAVKPRKHADLHAVGGAGSMRKKGRKI
jgi:hypothetical protein